MTAHLLALHGFVGSGADWDIVKEALAAEDGPDVLWSTPDLPGHGRSLPASPSQYTVPAMAASVAALLRAMDGTRVLMGYSMGARVALRAALDWPDLVDALVLIGANPGIADAATRERRAKEDADRAEEIREHGAARFCSRWARVPIIATQARVPEPYRSAMRDRRATNDTVGLALAAQVGGSGSMEPLWDRLRKWKKPALLVAGAQDRRYREIALQMAERMRRARTATVLGAGHAAHLEAPDSFASLLAEFLGGLRGIR